jgi:hypothetical protein
VTDLDSALAANRSAVDELILAAESAHAHWTTPRAPGKWSPQQVVEHVARALEEGANVVAGRPSKLPTLPALLRPLARFFFRRVLRTGTFPKARASKEMDPALAGLAGPASPAEARARLDRGLAAFERACRERAASGGDVPSLAFGRVPVAEYARFTALHTRHHAKQIPVVF